MIKYYNSYNDDFVKSDNQNYELKKDYKWIHRVPYLLYIPFLIFSFVYTKIVLNNTVGDAVKAGIRKNKAKKGLVQMLTVTEKQFEKMEYVCGNKKSDVIDSDEKLVIL